MYTKHLATLAHMSCTGSFLFTKPSNTLLTCGNIFWNYSNALRVLWRDSGLPLPRVDRLLFITGFALRKILEKINSRNKSSCFSCLNASACSCHLLCLITSYGVLLIRLRSVNSIRHSQALYIPRVLSLVSDLPDYLLTLLQPAAQTVNSLLTLSNPNSHAASTHHSKHSTKPSA